MTTSDTSRGAHVLVVDDQPINRMVLAVMLRDMGHVVTEAENGAEALALVERGNIDLVLMDLMMPVMDGLESCRRIKQDKGLVFLPVVFVTSLEDRESRVSCKAAGADEFLTKPIDRVELFARVDNLLTAKAFHDLQARQHEILQDELARSRDQLIHADRLMTLGNLAAGVGHEIKNSLSVLGLAVNLVCGAAARGEPVEEEDLAAIRLALRHLDTHAKHLLNYGRPGGDVSTTEDLCGIVRQTLELLATVGKTKTVEVRLTAPADGVPVVVNRTRVEQVLVNLVGNAVEAFDDAARDDRIVRVSVVRQDGLALCSVEDNGSGIPPEIQRRLFEPYLTTKAAGKGNGLGLPVVKRIVESYGGAMRVSSTPGRTLFEFSLPLAPGQ